MIIPTVLAKGEYFDSTIATLQLTWNELSELVACHSSIGLTYAYASRTDYIQNGIHEQACVLGMFQEVLLFAEHKYSYGQQMLMLVCEKI